MLKQERTMFFYGLTLKDQGPPLGASCALQERIEYFSTQQKLERWKTKNPELSKDSQWSMGEITIKVCKELVKLSKKKVRYSCPECGR